MRITRVPDELDAPDELDEVENLKEVILSYLLVDLAALPSGVADGAEGDKLPDAEHEEPEAEKNEEWNIGEQDGLVLEEIVAVSQEDRRQLQLPVLAEEEHRHQDTHHDQDYADYDVPGAAIQGQHLHWLHHHQDPGRQQSKCAQHERQVGHYLGDYYECHHVKKPYACSDPQSYHCHFPAVHTTELNAKGRVLEELVPCRTVRWLANASQSLDAVGGIVRADYACAVGS